LINYKSSSPRNEIIGNKFACFQAPLTNNAQRQMNRSPFIKKLVMKNSDKETEVISAFEGPNAFPKYSDKAVSPNVNTYRHLHKSNQMLSTIIWEANLRG
jgi:hypothetical protein